MKTKLKSILAAALCAVGLAAFAGDPLGSKDNPWDIGTPTASDVEAWTNGMGRLDIDGTGAMTDFSAPSPAPWADASFTEAVVGSNVTVIGASAFKSCPNLKTLVLNEQTPPTLGANNDFSKAKIFVPAGKAGDYRASGGWTAYADAIEEMRSVKGKELTKHLYEMTYSWWDAVKANDIGEMLAEIMAKPEQEEDDDLFFPYQVFDWYRQVLEKQSALCTSCRNGNFVGRNFDWGYDDVDECVMHIPAAEGRLASVGVVSWFFPEEMQKLFDVDSFLPELTMDGVNEKGVAINVNVVPGGDNGWTTNTNPAASKRLNAGFAVRTVLDNATNAAHAVEILESRNIYSLKPLEFHWMISDKDESYVVECVSNALVVLKAKDARPKMSNYYVTHSPSVGEYDIRTHAELTRTFHTPRAMGIERYANVSNGLESVDSVKAMFTHMTNVWYKLKYLPGNEQKYWSDMNGAPVPGKPNQCFTAFDNTAELNVARSNAFVHIQENYVAVTNYEAQHEGSRTIDHDECPWLTNEVVHTVHTSIYDIEKRMLRVVVQEDAAHAFNAYLTPPPEISAVSAEGWLDLTVGDRVAEAEEPIVVDPKWGNANTATVKIDGESSRTYASECVDAWNTTTLTPGRYALAFTAGTTNEAAAFWKIGDDWVVQDLPPSSAEGVFFESGKTHLILGTTAFADSAPIEVEDGAKFAYGAGAGFKGGAVEMPKRYETKTVEDGLYQIVEKIRGSEDNPWVVGDDGKEPPENVVEAYTNGTELVIVGTGAVTDFSEIPGEVKRGITEIKITEPTVKGAADDAFKDFNGVDLTLPDNWQGELPENGEWYGATDVTLARWPMAVRNVKPRPRYPWNGLVDVSFDLSGAGEVAVALSVTTNGVRAVANPTVITDATFDLETGKELKGLRITWDAKQDFNDDELHEKIKVKLSVSPAEPD